MNKLRNACILVVDDEPKYVKTIKIILEANGYSVITARDGESAVTLAASESPDLILLDVRMPQLNGHEACRRIREFSLAPVLMLSALAQKTDIVKGLDAGADDYITKPFSTEELLARVRAALRRVENRDNQSTEPIFQTGALRLDYASQRVFIAEQEIKLTATEYRLLCELAHSAGRIVSSETILENVWGPGYAGEDQLIPRVIHRLRRKIEPDAENPRYVITRPGLGYILETSTE